MTFLLRFATFVLLVCVNSPTFATLYKCIFVKLDDYETMDNDGRRVSFVDTCFSFFSDFSGHVLWTALIWTNLWQT